MVAIEAIIDAEKSKNISRAGESEASIRKKDERLLSVPYARPQAIMNKGDVA